MLTYLLIDLLEDVLPGRCQLLLPLEVEIFQVVLVLEAHGVGVSGLAIPDLFLDGCLDCRKEGAHVFVQDLINSFYL